MSVYAITAVQLGEGGRIERAKIQQVDPALNMWIGERVNLEAHELADMIICGDIIYSVFHIAGGGVACGPKFRRCEHPGRRESIQLSEEKPAMTVHDLDQY